MAKGLSPRSAAQLWGNAKKYYALLTRRDTPFYLKAAVVFAVLYLISPIDLVPDWLALFGIVDDIALVSLLLGFVFRRLKRRYPEIENQDRNE